MLVVFGATGFLGEYVLAGAREHGVPVRAISRLSRQSVEDCEVEWARVDFSSPASVEAVIGEGDTVINLAFAQLETENLELLDVLLEICIRKRTECFIHCSTAVVVGRVNAEVITEDAPCSPFNRYEQLKMRLEGKVMSAARRGLRTIIVRPTAMVGPKGVNIAFLARSLLFGSPALNYIRACIFGNRMMHVVPVTTVAEALLYLARTPARFCGETYIISADEDPDNRFLKLERLLTESLNLPPRRLSVLPLPRVFLSTILRLCGRSDHANERIYSSEKLRSTGFQHSSTVATAVTNFGRWYRKSIFSAQDDELMR